MSDPDKIFDGLLVLQFKAGNQKAINFLINRHHKKLCKHAFWYTYDIDASKDIVQDSWTIIINKLDTLKDPNLFGNWAFRIVTRKSLDYVHKQKRESVKLREYYETSISLESDVDDETEIPKLLKAIQSLPKDQQAVLRLFYRENYSLKDISNIHEVSIGTVKSRLFHAREKLKTILNNYKIPSYRELK